MNDTLLDQADSLMRRRSFIAGAKPTETTPSNQAAISAEHNHAHASLEDIPVLTEVVEEPSAPRLTEDTPSIPHAEPHTDQIEAIINARVQERLLEQQLQLKQQLEIWLEEQLPKVVNRAMDGIADYVISEVKEHARVELLQGVERSASSDFEEAGEGDRDVL